MKKLMLLAVISAVILTAVPAFAMTTFTFEPKPVDMQDLDHSYYYGWFINWVIPANEKIVSARLTIDDIDNWDNNLNILYIHLLDDPFKTGGTIIGTNTKPTYSSTAKRWYDGQVGGDNWGLSPFLTSYTDTNGTGYPEDFTYLFNPTQLGLLESFAANDYFGLGFDPDCHYWNNGIKLQITTAAVPEPASLSLMGLGLFGIMLRRRKAK